MKVYVLVNSLPIAHIIGVYKTEKAAQDRLNSLFNDPLSYGLNPTLEIFECEVEE